MSNDHRIIALLFVLAPIACVNATDDDQGSSPLMSAAGSTGKSGGGCGGEAAAGGYMKFGGDWDGAAGNAYGYPPGYTGNDCGGFGFHDGCAFWESCGYPCTTSDECPTLDDGPTPVCAVTHDEASAMCVLPCTTDANCPDGMHCVFHPYGFGSICLWEHTFG